MKNLLITLLIVIWSSAAIAAPTAEQPDRNDEIYNLENNLLLLL